MCPVAWPIETRIVQAAKPAFGRCKTNERNAASARRAIDRSISRVLDTMTRKAADCEATMHEVLGILSSEHSANDLQRALRLCNVGLALSLQLKNLPHQIVFREMLCVMQYQMGNFSQAVFFAEHAATLAEQHDFASERQNANALLLLSLSEAGLHVEAKRYREAVLSAISDGRNPCVLAKIANGIAVSFCREQKYDSAEAFVRHAMLAAENSCEVSVRTSISHNATVIATILGKFDEARQYLSKTSGHLKELPSLRMESENHYIAALIELQCDGPKPALKRIRCAIEGFRALQLNHRAHSASEFELAMVLKFGRKDHALIAFDRCQALRAKADADNLTQQQWFLGRVRALRASAVHQHTLQNLDLQQKLFDLEASVTYDDLPEPEQVHTQAA